MLLVPVFERPAGIGIDMPEAETALMLSRNLFSAVHNGLQAHRGKIAIVARFPHPRPGPRCRRRTGLLENRGGILSAGELPNISPECFFC